MQTDVKVTRSAILISNVIVTDKLCDDVSNDIILLSMQSQQAGFPQRQKPTWDNKVRRLWYVQIESHG